MIRRFLQGIMRWAALMGFLVKDDESIETRDPDRQWGPAAGGFLLSAKARVPEATGDAKLSIVLKNAGTEVVQTAIPSWLFFYKLALNPMPRMTAFGERALAAQRDTSYTDLVLRPGKSIESELPVGMLYDLRSNGPFQVTVSCEIAGVTVTSNEVTLGAR